ncbi:hypothetical protein C5Y93_02365 [Blastopirellula marina]|uniref:Uncharacterized protein n=1 Tax=Blastopirellula marina TaxID=124 RepID=A0A2S8GU21_9BACT|nr:hypothetical protein C5Y93_02365 [Blastopirellula marina]
MIDRIDELSALADQLWAESLRDTAKLADCRDQLATAYDGMQLQPRVYERLARQSEKPLLQRALAVRDSPADAPLRREIEQIVRLEIEDFLALEEEIAAKLRQIDAAREAVVQAHHDQIEAYVREAGRTDDVSLAAGRQGARLAAMRFDDREGFDFMDYAELWIDRELDRVGLSDVE